MPSHVLWDLQVYETSPQGIGYLNTQLLMNLVMAMTEPGCHYTVFIVLIITMTVVCSSFYTYITADQSFADKQIKLKTIAQKLKNLRANITFSVNSLQFQPECHRVKF